MRMKAREKRTSGKENGNEGGEKKESGNMSVKKRGGSVNVKEKGNVSVNVKNEKKLELDHDLGHVKDQEKVH